MSSRCAGLGCRSVAVQGPGWAASPQALVDGFRKHVTIRSRQHRPRQPLAHSGDIDSALQHLDEIWWRVPQYTVDIRSGDVVLLWKSGQEAGIVGVGRITAEPREHASSEDEVRLVRDPEIAGTKTRALVRVRPTECVPKDQIRALPSFEEHSIIKAPLGTVIPITEDDYSKLAPLVDEPPEVDTLSGNPDIPPPFAWDQRASDLLEVANNQYASGWSTKAQIDRRRGWLQSAGMLSTDESRRLLRVRHFSTNSCCTGQPRRPSFVSPGDFLDG